MNNSNLEITIAFEKWFNKVYMRDPYNWNSMDVKIKEAFFAGAKEVQEMLADTEVILDD